MRLRSIRYLGWLKLVAFIELALPLLLLPLFLLAYMIAPDSVDVAMPTQAKLGPITLDNLPDSAPATLALLAVLYLLGMAIQAFLLWLIARTPLGHIRV